MCDKKRLIMRYILTIIFTTFCSIISAQNNCDSLLQVLNNEMAKAPEYIAERIRFIDALKSDDKIDSDYSLNRQIYNLYRSFQYDSAYTYAAKSLQIANSNGNPNLILESRSNLLFSLLSSGFFKEGIDIINSTDSSKGDSLVRADFHSNAARLYADLSHYHNSETFSKNYNKLSILHYDSAMMFLPIDSYAYLAISAVKTSKKPLSERISNYKTLLNITPPDEHEFAINSSNLANLILTQGDTTLAIEYWIKSAIVDTRLSIMETTAKRDLAKILYAKKDIDNAMKYISASLEEANYYNAKHRLLQINTILPIIEKSHLTIIERQKDSLIISLLLVAVLAFLLIILIYTLYRKNKTINQAKNSIELKSTELEKMNVLLNRMNCQLKEQDVIKNIYIFESLNTNSQYLSNMESMLRKIVNTLRQNDKIHLLRGIGIDDRIKEERLQLLTSFDRAFFILFPNFIEQYNTLFSEESKVQIDPNKSLNTEMRIVALIRLGIKESDKVAQFLSLSVNTVYTYKAKIKNRCIIKNAEFDDIIMSVIK